MMGHLTETPRACFLLISISSHSWGSPVVMSEGDTRLLLPQPGQECSTLQLQPDQPCIFKNVLHQLPVTPQQHSCSLEGSQEQDEELLQLIGNEGTGKNQYPAQNTHTSHIPAWSTLGKREVGSHSCFSQACQVQSDQEFSLCSWYFPHQAKTETQFLSLSILHLPGTERMSFLASFSMLS